jgi:hypothetical protein
MGPRSFRTFADFYPFYPGEQTNPWFSLMGDRRLWWDVLTARVRI